MTELGKDAARLVSAALTSIQGSAELDDMGALRALVAAVVRGLADQLPPAEWWSWKSPRQNLERLAAYLESGEPV